MVDKNREGSACFELVFRLKTNLQLIFRNVCPREALSYGLLKLILTYNLPSKQYQNVISEKCYCNFLFLMLFL